MEVIHIYLYFTFPFLMCVCVYMYYFLISSWILWSLKNPSPLLLHTPATWHSLLLLLSNLLCLFLLFAGLTIDIFWFWVFFLITYQKKYSVLVFCIKLCPIFNLPKSAFGFHPKLLPFDRKLSVVTKLDKSYIVEYGLYVTSCDLVNSNRLPIKKK